MKIISFGILEKEPRALLKLLRCRWMPPERKSNIQYKNTKKVHINLHKTLLLVGFV